MQIAAHYSAAIEILDQVLLGQAAEKALLSWSRASRFAGSKDRAAVRDIVFDCLRKKKSYGARFTETGRGLALGRALEVNEIHLFNGEGFAPMPLSEEESKRANEKVEYHSLADHYDFPQFLENPLKAQYGDQLPEIMQAMRERAPVDIRVNRLKTTMKEAVDLLARDHIFTEPLEHDEDALRIRLNPRRLSQSRAYNYGYVELQDLSSQMIARLAAAKTGESVLDYCAGGGGKTLALGAHMKGEGRIDAWDINPKRMEELRARAGRAGLMVNILTQHPLDQYDLVFVDAPCSGSGAWRRTPDAKWRLKLERVDELVRLQAEILAQAARHVKAGGRLLYATCSLFEVENQSQISAFLETHSDFKLADDMKLNPLNAGDGFYGAILETRPKTH